MPADMTAAEVAEFDQGVAALDENVTTLAAAWHERVRAVSPDQAIADFCCWLIEEDWSREELAAMLVLATRRIPEGEVLL